MKLTLTCILIAGIVVMSSVVFGSRRRELIDKGAAIAPGKTRAIEAPLSPDSEAVDTQPIVASPSHIIKSVLPLPDKSQVNTHDDSQIDALIHSQYDYEVAHGYRLRLVRQIEEGLENPNQDWRPAALQTLKAVIDIQKTPSSYDLLLGAFIKTDGLQDRNATQDVAEMYVKTAPHSYVGYWLQSYLAYDNGDFSQSRLWMEQASKVGPPGIFNDLLEGLKNHPQDIEFQFPHEL